jgi:hypothetical protein
MNDKRTIVLSLHYLPSIGWYTNLIKYPTVVLENCEHFVKSGGFNRTHISTAQGRQLLTIPVAGGRNHRAIVGEMVPDHSKNWLRQHWHAIQTAYGKAPYFEDYSPWFESIYSRNATTIWQFNLELHGLILRLLSIKMDHPLTNEYQKRLPEDWVDGRDNHSKLYHTINKPYYQSFQERNGFISNCSIIDLLFHLGPESTAYLKQLTELNANETF